MSFNPRLKAGDRREPAAASSAQAARASASVASQAGWVYHCFGYSASAQYIQVFDAAALPANGTNCLVQIKVLADSWFSFDFGPGGGGMRFFNGFQVCNSSTLILKTLGAADCQFVTDYSLKP